MANVPARASNPVPSVQDKMIRNKRKYRTDQSAPQTDSTTFPFTQTECHNYGLLEKGCEGFNLEHLASVCDMCKTLMCGPEERLEWEDGFQDADWSEFTESRLEEILMGNLDVIFNNAIKLVSSYGYSEEVATNAVLAAGAHDTGKESLAGMVDSALQSLRSGQELSRSLNPIEDLAELEKSILKRMVGLVSESQPFFSTGDAMWCLLICDMNVARACAVDYDGPNTGPLAHQVGSGSSPSSGVGPVNESIVNTPSPSSQSETSKVLGLPIPRSPSIASNVWSVISNVKPDENPNPSTDHNKHQKEGGSKKGANSGLRKEAMLRSKSISLEKSLRALGSKAASKACKHGVPANLLLDRKCKYTASDSTTGITVKSTFKLSKLMGGGVLRKDAVLDLSFHATKTSSSSSSSCCSTGNTNTSTANTTNSSAAVPTANTNLSLSIQSTNAPNPPSTNQAAANPEATNNTNKDLFIEWVPQDKKDEVALKLVPHMRELQAQMQDWTDWAQQKVMQAARRLAKDKEELQSLRQEKDEVGRLQEERKSLEESTRKKLAEMEAAIAKAGGQVERANSAARRLRMENSSLRLEMEAAKTHAAVTAANCRELSKNEMKSLKKFQSWEAQRALLQDELVTEKNKLAHLQRLLEQAKQQHHQLQGCWQQEEKARIDALAQVNCLKKEREQVETTARAEENGLVLKAENDLQRFKSEIRALEQQIQQLRVTSDSSKLVPPRWGLQDNKSYAARLSQGRSNNNNNHNTSQDKAKVVAVFQEAETDEVQRERECVMCLSEEMSVLFLPCAHQVVCVKCNEMHESQGMTDCPSCRAPIHRRIVVRCADS
ncbi:hypothetical protein LUZ60_011618 [Juncus effusus]|nr:hypothetical protein LUZ60_011618 [Juncus effusus]